MTETRLRAEFPEFALEITHRRADPKGAETLTIALTAASGFEALAGRGLFALPVAGLPAHAMLGPAVLMVEAWRLLLAPWLALPGRGSGPRH